MAVTMTSGIWRRVVWHDSTYVSTDSAAPIIAESQTW